jgi:alpha-L-arabinofuranosidase
MVNASDADAPVQITLTGTGSLASTATALTLSADPQATNAIDTPERVVPVQSTVTGVKSGFIYTVPKHGIVVLTMRTR